MKLRKIFSIVLIVGLLSALLGTVVMAKIPAAPATQSYTWKTVAVSGGGYIPGIIFSPKQQNLIYARTDMGGAYRWNQATQNWTQLLAGISADDWSLTGVESLAPDPVDPNIVYLAVGTYTNSWTSINGAILKSTDKGNTFTRVMLPFKNGSNMPGNDMGERLAVDPNKNSILFLGARSGNGLWKSTDAGMTWSRDTGLTDTGTYVEDPSSEFSGDHPGVTWVTFDPRSGSTGNASQIIYVGVASLDHPIYRSTDGGATFAPLAGQPTGFLAPHGRLSANGILYVAYSNNQSHNGNKGDVWKFDTATSTWTMISPIPSSSSDDYFGYGGVGVDKLNPNTIMVSTHTSWWPDDIIFRSTDAGATWKRIWDFASYPARTLRYTMDISNAPWLDFGNKQPVDPVPAVKIGWFIGDLSIDPFDSNRMFYGTGTGIYGSTNLTNWDTAGTFTLKSMALGIEQNAIMGLISPPSGAPLLSVMGDLGGFRHTNLTTPPSFQYTVPYIGNYNDIDYAELNPSFIVRVGKGDPTAASPANLSTAFSSDGAATWSVGNATVSGITSGGTVAAGADASAVVWAPEGGAVSRSTDNGNTWTAVQGGVPNGARVASDRVNPNKFYAFYNGTLYRSTDKGVTFTAAATGLPTSAKIKAVPGQEGNIWLAGGGNGLYRSTDGGATFTRVASSSVTSADSVGFGKAAPGQSYMAIFIVGTVDGVKGAFRSDDVGATWVQVNDAQHQYGAIGSCITGDPRIYGRVYLCTNGFGIPYGDIAGSPSATNTPTQTVGASPTKTLTPVISPTLTRTSTTGPTSTLTPVVTTPAPTKTLTPVTPVLTSTKTNTPVTPVSATPTRTLTPGSTFTRTPTAGPSFTPTKTLTRTITPTSGVTPTRTITPTTGAGACSPVTSTITAPFSYDGTGALCWQSNNLGSYINSWNLTSLTINGINETNLYIASGSYPAKLNGYWYISYNSSVAWGHFEAK